MFRQFSRRIMSLSSKGNGGLIRDIRRGLAAQQHPKETISYDNIADFPLDQAGIIQNSYYTDRIEIPKCSAAEYIWSNVNGWWDKTAVVCGVTGRSYTYTQLRDHCAALSFNLRTKLGLNQGDSVGICMPNVPEYILASLGIIEAGLVICTYNPIYTPDEISRQINDSGTKVMICVPELYPVVKKAIEMSGKDIRVVAVKAFGDVPLDQGVINFAELIEYKHGMGAGSLYNCDLNDTVITPYSSGTTGLPKGVMLTHRNIMSNSEQVNAPSGNDYIVHTTTETFQDVLHAVLPFYHMMGWHGIFFSKLVKGVKVVTLPKFEPGMFLKSLIDHKATVLHLVPPLVMFMNHFEALKPEYLESIRLVISGAAPLAKTDVEQFIKRAPQVKFLQGYGMTELSPVTIIPPIGYTNYGSCGYPAPASQAKVVKVGDDTFTGVGPNVKGEILVRGPHVMKGYLNNEQATRETLIDNKWLRTGDIGYYDDNGEFYITDRLKELIKVKGYQVAPAELEATLRRHPAVAEAAVIGVPNDRLGEAPRGYVVLKPNATANAQDILSFTADKLAEYKQMDQVVIVEAIPKNPTGKILRRQLKIQLGLE